LHADQVLQIWSFLDLHDSLFISDTQFFLNDQGSQRCPERYGRSSLAALNSEPGGVFLFQILPGNQLSKLHPAVSGVQQAGKNL
jgi:hypothetical protein